MDTLVKWLAGLLGIVVVYRLVAYIWNGSILEFLVASFAVGLLLAWVAWNKYRKSRRGFWVRYISPNIVRADRDDFAIEYHEGKKSLILHGKLLEGSKRLITVPRTQDWDTKMPDWARGRREEIRERIKTELNPKVYEIGE
jgi:hypothetical protein